MNPDINSSLNLIVHLHRENLKITKPIVTIVKSPKGIPFVGWRDVLADVGVGLGHKVCSNAVLVHELPQLPQLHFINYQ